VLGVYVFLGDGILDGSCICVDVSHLKGDLDE
jgi:hypothetical protein